MKNETQKPMPTQGAEVRVELDKRASVIRDNLQRAKYTTPKLQAGVAPVINGGKSDGRPWFLVKNEASKDAAEINIYDQIGKDWWSGEGTDAKEFADALKAIDANRAIKVFINSPGGNVYDGIAIYNLLRGRKGRVDTYNIGLAASISSVILLATANGGRVHVAKTSQTMIHKASTVAMGGVKEMKQAINALESAEKSIVIAYQEKTGKSEAELSDAMENETWFSGEDAKGFGFADEVTEAAPISNSFDISNFRNVPEAFRKLNNSAANPSGQNPTAPSNMDKKKIIALLKKHGVTVDDNATIEQLEAQLETVLNAKAKEQTKNDPADGTTAAALALVTAQLTELKAKADTERKSRVTAEIDRHIRERRLPAALRASYINRAIADETVLDEVAQLPQVLPAEPISDLVITGETSSEDIARGVLNLNKPIAALIEKRVQPTDALVQTIRANAVEKARIITKNIDKLLPMMNAHTIDSDLKRSVIMTQGMRAFKRRLLPLSAFSMRYNNIPLLGTDKVQVPYYPLFTTASTDFSSSYSFSESSDTQAKEITINKRKYQPFKYTSSWLSRQPYFDVARLFALQVEQLGVDVFTDVLSVATLANFGAAVFNGPAGAFGIDQVIALRTVAEQADWPTVGRSLMLDSTYEENILKAQARVDEAGTDAALREGVTGRIAGFNTYGSPRIPTNSESLYGFIAMPSAIIAATSPITPGPGVRSQLVSYDVVTDPDTGISFEYRFWGNPDSDEDREVVECNYGYVTGEAAALKRITNA